MFEVKDASTRETLPGIPSPLLIQTGYGEAYDAGEPGHPFWRLRDDSYDQPGTVYRKVSIVHVEEFWVDVTVGNPEAEAGDTYYPYKDTVMVVATNAEQARTLAPAVALKFAQDRDGDAPYSVAVTRVKKEF